MTTSRWVEQLLSREWDPNELKEVSVPEPKMQVGGGSGTRSRSVQVDEDTIFFSDGGDPTITPQSLNYREEYVESFVDVEIWTARGRDRITGEFGEDGEYAGMAGEVKRILDKYRVGMPSDGPVPDPGYDIVRFDNYSDEVEEVGAGIWKGTWTVTFITFANQIGQEAENRA